MALVVYNNIYSVTAQNKLSIANNSLQKSIERLSSGLRINHASDDASGLAISEKLRSQIRGMAKASMNAQDAASFLQTAEGGLEVIGDMLQRMRELAVQAGNGTYTSNDRKELQKEVDQLKAEINRVASSTEYNTKKLLTGQSAALWSSSNPEALSAIVRGAPASGNYNIDVEALGGSNYVYKTDIFTDASVQKSAQTYEYSYAYTGKANSATFANVFGEIQSKHTVVAEVSTGAGTAVTSAISTYGVYRGILASGEESNVSARLITAAGTGAAAIGAFVNAQTTTGQQQLYIVAEFLKDGDLSNSGFSEKKTDVLKFYAYNATTGEKYDLQVYFSNAATATINGGSTSAATVKVGTSASNLTLSINVNSRFSEGDKLVFAAQGGVAAAANSTIVQVDNGPKKQVTTTAAGFTASYAIFEMNNGNISVGRGYVKVPATSTTSPTTGTHSVAITPSVITKSVLSLDQQRTIGTTANAQTTRILGGIYPNGLDVTVTKGPWTGKTAQITIASRYFQNAAVQALVNAAVASADKTGSYIVEILNDMAKIGSGSITANFKITYVDAITGLEEVLTIATAAGSGQIALAKNTTAGTVTFSADSLNGADGRAHDLSITITAAPTPTQVGLFAGDKVLVHVSRALTASGTAGAADALVKAEDFTLAVKQKNLGEFSIYNVQMDSRGTIHRSEIQVSLADASSGTIKFKTPSSIASLNTKLKDIPLFTNADGRMVLDNTQEITLFGNGKTATMYLEGNDTVKDFQNKLNAAILALGMTSGNASIDEQLAHYVEDGKESDGGNFAVAGTFVFQGGILGGNSMISFIGDQDVLNALSITTIQNGEDADTKITVTDAHTNKLVGSDVVSDGVLRGVIKGIDVKVSNPPLTVTYNDKTGTMSFQSPKLPTTMQLHIVDSRTTVQIGANEGQIFDVSIAEMSTAALEIDDAYVLTMGESQKAITKFSQALEKVNGARATIGAQINRLEFTVRNLAVSRENLIASESRIRDLDVAAESADFARNQILVNAAVAMLAQANTMPQVALQLIGR